MAIGTLGKNIVFEVSDKKALVIRSLGREVAGRWTTHTTFGTKPKAEFLGPENRSVTLEIYLSANLGVKPRAVLDEVAAMVEAGAAEFLVIGGKAVSSNPFRITAASETWGTMYNRGELAKATLSITLEEYV